MRAVSLPARLLLISEVTVIAPKVKNRRRSPRNPTVPLGAFIVENKNTHIYTPIFTTVLSTVAVIWKKPRCPAIDEGRKMCDILSNKEE